MNNDLDFRLPGDEKQRERRPGQFMKVTLAVVLIVALLNLGVLAVFVVQEITEKLREGDSYVERVSAEEEKALAQRLEDRGLSLMAAMSWSRYMTKTHLSDEEKAKCHYRIGRLYQEAERYDRALEYYYRSELAAVLPDLQVEMKQRKQVCFRKLGNYAGLGRELSAMTSLGNEEVDEENVVAEIDGLKISERDLENEIRTYIEVELSQYKKLLGPEELEKEKERLYDRFNRNEDRLEFLNRYISMELLSREAVDLELNKKPENVRMSERLEREYYSQKVLESAISDRVVLTESDLRDYYSSHVDEFTDKEKVALRAIATNDEQTAKNIIEELNAGAAFEECSSKYNEDEELKKAGGKVANPMARGAYIPGIGNDPAIHEHLFQLGEGEHSSAPLNVDGTYYVFEVETKIPSQVRPFEEVKQLVEQKKKRIKEEEVYRALMDELRRKYNVLIHYSHFQPGPESNGESSTRLPADSQ